MVLPWSDGWEGGCCLLALVSCRVHVGSRVSAACLDCIHTCWEIS